MNNLLLREYIKGLILEADCNQGLYWGIGGAGLILVCSEDKTVFLQKRSGRVTGGAGQWAFPGGGIHPDNAPWEQHYDTPIPDEDILPDASSKFIEIANREFEEEVGLVPPHSIIDSYMYEDCGFKYKTFIGDVTLAAKESYGDFRLNWESSESGWYSLEEFNGKDLFFGFTPQLISKVNAAIS